MELAAVASAAVPGLAPTGVAGAPDDGADFDSVMLLDHTGRQWRVRAPKHPDASLRLENELLVLRAFNPGVRAGLPFSLPTVAGTVNQDGLTTFVYSHLPGTTRELDDLAAAADRVAPDIGRTIAAIHDLSPELVRDADLPSYTADEFRQRRLNELDQAATTGRIPSLLLRRWENALEDVLLWQFEATVVHGDLHEDNLLIGAGRVTAVTGWTDLRVGDPADDFAWLVAADDQSFADKVLRAYSEARRDAPDEHLLRRAALSAEFALAQWLVRGLAVGSPDMVAEAEGMLSTLEQDVQALEDSAAAAAENAAREAAAEGSAVAAGNPMADDPTARNPVTEDTDTSALPVIRRHS